MQENNLYSAHSSQAIETSKVLRNTYMLLGMTLLFSAIMAGLGMMLNIGYGISLICSLASLAIIWLVIPRTANSEKGLLAVFAFTGLLGFGLGPILNHYLNTAQGTSIVMQSLGGTAIIFFSLSGYALATRKDFSFLGGFLMVGLILAILASIANIFLAIPVLNLAIPAVVILIMSGFILYDTSAIIHGGERNYILATVSMYLNLYNIFVNLLHILGVMGDD